MRALLVVPLLAIVTAWLVWPRAADDDGADLAAHSMKVHEAAIARLAGGADLWDVAGELERFYRAEMPGELEHYAGGASVRERIAAALADMVETGNYSDAMKARVKQEYRRGGE